MFNVDCIYVVRLLRLLMNEYFVLRKDKKDKKRKERKKKRKEKKRKVRGKRVEE